MRDNSKKMQRNYLIMFSIVLIFFSSVRYEIGRSDYRAYVNSFYRISSRNWKQMLENEEIGYQIIQKTISLITNNPQVFFLISSLLIVISFSIFFFKYSKDMSLSLMLFYMLGLYFTAHNITRQYMATAICLFAYHFAIQKKPHYFIILVLLASTIHTSALVALIIYPLCKQRVTKKIFFAYVLSIPVFYFTYPALLQFAQRFAYSSYDENSYGMTGSNSLNIILPIVSICLMALIIFSTKKSSVYENFRPMIIMNTNEQRVQNLSFHLVMLNVVVNVLEISRALIIGRLSAYFDVGICIFFPILISKFTKSQSRLIKIFVMAGAIAYFLVFNYYGKLIPSPYNFYWNFS